MINAQPTTRMARSDTVVVCLCNLCKGESVKQSIAIKHKRDAELAERKAARKLGMPIANTPSTGSKSGGAVDGLVDEVFRWTLGGGTSNAQWKQARVHPLYHRQAGSLKNPYITS